MKSATLIKVNQYIFILASIFALISCSLYPQKKAAADVLLDKETKNIKYTGRSKNTNKTPSVISEISFEKLLFAQVNQDPIPLPQTLPPKDSPAPRIPALPEFGSDEREVEIDTIRVTGDTVLSQEQIDSIVKPLIGKTVSLRELKLAIDELTQLYLEQGYITSRALLVKDSIPTKNIQVQIVEGSAEKIEVEGTERLENYVRDRVNLAATTPLNSAKLEDQLRLLRLDPLFENVEASLSAGNSPQVGQSIIKVRVTEADRHQARLSIDNYSPPSVGSERLGFNFSRRSLVHPGDKISAQFYPRLESLTNTFDLGLEYQIPVSSKNAMVTTGINLNRNEIIDPLGDDFDDLEIEGESEKFSLGFRQPIIRNPRQELALSFAFDYQDGQTLLFQEGTSFGLGADEEGNTTTSVFRFGQEYIKRQVSGAWALRSQLNLGTGILGATENEAPIPDGKFVSWLGQLQRVQILNNSNFLVIQGDVQLTGNSLLPSQQFVIGGGQSVKGYRQNVRSGDNGIIFSVEDRLALVKNKAGEPIFTFTPFLNLGTVWNNSDNPNELPEENFIAALGVGFIWEPINGLNLQLNFAPPLISLDDEGNSLQDNGLHFSLDYGSSF